MSKSTCSIDGCNNKVVARGWCNKHYLRWANHGDPLGGRPGPSVHVSEVVDGSKCCSSCGRWKPLDQFGADKRAHGGRRSQCKKCRSGLAKQWYEENHTIQLERHREYCRNNVEHVRETDRRRYYRDKPKRVELAKASCAKRRMRIDKAGFDKGITTLALRDRDGDRCCYCGVRMTFKLSRAYIPNKATVEHVLPLSRGGSHTWSNVALACWQCNLSKNCKTNDEWRGSNGYNGPALQRSLPLWQKDSQGEDGPKDLHAAASRTD